MGPSVFQSGGRAGIMSAKATYFRVGVFVIISIFLLVAAIFIFGATELIPRDAILVETYINETVQGLEVGSKVRSLGVEVGQVKQISFVTSEYELSQAFSLRHGRYVLIRMALYPDLLGGDLSEKEIRERLPSMVQRGLRMRLASQGFTGAKYLEAELLDPERYPPLEIEWEPEIPYVPYAPGVFTTIVESIDNLTQQMKNAGFDRISGDVQTLLHTIQGKVEQIDVSQMMAKASTVLDDIDGLVANPDIQEAMANFRDASGDTREMMARANEKFTGEEFDDIIGSVNEALKDLPVMTERVKQTMARMNILVLAQFEQLNETLVELNAIMDNLEEMTNTGKKYPAWLLFGEAPLETQPERD
jgi:paraquat-inducible protein B